MNSVAYKQHKFIAHCSRGWAFRNKVSGEHCEVLVKALFWVSDSWLLTVSSLGEWGKGVLSNLFDKDSNLRKGRNTHFLINGGMQNSYSTLVITKVPPPNTIILHIRIWIYEFWWNTNIQTTTENETYLNIIELHGGCSPHPHSILFISSFWNTDWHVENIKLS